MEKKSSAFISYLVACKRRHLSCLNLKPLYCCLKQVCYKPYAAAYPAPGPTDCPALVTHLWVVHVSPLHPFRHLEVLESSAPAQRQGN